MCTAAMFVPGSHCVYMHTLTRLLLHQAAAIYTTPARAFFPYGVAKGGDKESSLQGMYSGVVWKEIREKVATSRTGDWELGLVCAEHQAHPAGRGVRRRCGCYSGLRMFKLGSRSSHSWFYTPLLQKHPRLAPTA